MRPIAVRASLTAVSSIVATTLATAQAAPSPAPRPTPMVLTISAWPDGAQIPAKFTQAGEQVSPELKWSNVPAGTQSFVVNMLDPDVAISRGTETQPHWIVWNVPAGATGLPEAMKPGAELPDGTRQISASGPGYRGPGAPATGPLHHYTFEIYALDTKVDVTPSSATPAVNAALETRAAVMKAMQGHVLGKAVYVGLFRRPQ
jgi:Raf kinase inhibitor-like YbhB/YbcL family protein